MLVAHDAILGIPRGRLKLKARSTAKEHTNEVESGGRDPGVSRPLCGRPLDMGKRCVSAFRHAHFHRALGCRSCLLVAIFDQLRLLKVVEDGPHGRT